MKPLGMQIDPFQRHGYSSSTAGACLHCVGHFAYWLTHMYVETDLVMKERALQAVQPP